MKVRESSWEGNSLTFLIVEAKMGAVVLSVFPLAIIG
jgi:Flp pilus assembly protein TadB